MIRSCAAIRVGSSISARGRNAVRCSVEDDLTIGCHRRSVWLLLEAPGIAFHLLHEALSRAVTLRAAHGRHQQLLQGRHRRFDVCNEGEKM